MRRDGPGRQGDDTVRIGVVMGAVAPLMLALCAVLNGYDTPLQVPGIDTSSLAAWSVVALVLAAAIVAIPWTRWRREAFLVVPALLVPFAVLQGWSTNYFATPLGVGVQVSEFFVICTLVGLTQRRGVVAVFSTYLFVVFAAGVVVHDAGSTLLISQILTVPVAVVVGELVSWSVNGLRWSRAVDRRRAADLELLSRSITALRGDRSVDDAARLLGGLACELLGGTHAAVVLREPEGELRELTGSALVLSAARVAEIHRCLTRREVHVGGPDGDGAPTLFLPLAGEGAPFAALVVAMPTEPDAFGLGLAELLANEAGSALDQARRLVSLTEEANRDPLTGLGNRRHAEQLLAGLRRGDALLIMDLDQFKPVNDTYGHATGDELLRQLSAFLRREVRDADALARYGGDEFLAILHGVDGDALATADRLRKAWRETNPLSTLSVGVAVHHEAQAPEATLDHADQALYRVKQTGGDRAEVFDPLGS